MGVVRALYEGREITPAEMQVYRLLAHGYEEREIALILDKSYFTARRQRAAIFCKLDVSSSLEAANHYWQNLADTDNTNTVIPPLFEREHDYMRCLCAGMSNKEISRALYVSLQTTKNMLRTIYRKLGVRNRIEAVAAYQGYGYGNS